MIHTSYIMLMFIEMCLFAVIQYSC